ncbi:MAG: hypothetical protein ACRDXX_02270, partial [Stackebrandtia sp.]
AYLSLGNSGETVLHANTSAKLCQVGRPGWAAAVLTAAQGHAVVGDHLTAAHIAHDVLDQVPPERLRATSRTRLAKLCADTDRTDLIDRVHALPPLVAAN